MGARVGWRGMPIAGLLLALVLMQQSLAAAPSTPTPPVLQCPAGATTWLAGSGPVGVGVLLHWDDRVVGGGVVKADGQWRVPLMLATAQAGGTYVVTVVQRGAGAVLTAWICEVDRVRPVYGRPMPMFGGQPRTDRVPSRPVAPTGTVAPTRTALPSTPLLTSTLAPTSTSEPTTPPSSISTPTALPPTSTPPPPVTPAPPTAVSSTCQVCLAEATISGASAYVVITTTAVLPVDLAGWQLHLADGSTPPVAFGTGTMVAADADLVVWIDPTAADGWAMAMPQPGQVVILQDAAGVEQGRVPFVVLGT